MVDSDVLHLGIDLGSTTIKVVVTDCTYKTLFSEYRRHFSEIKAVLSELIKHAHKVVGDAKVSVMVTGSGGVAMAEALGVDFIQEVVAMAKAVEIVIPKTDVAIELGGEDAKIVYFKDGIEQRMNGVCAGGTGSFIDQMATLLQTDANGLNEMAKDYKVIYPIASRCGVFAKTDIQPLINEGAAKKDLAASIFQAVVNQTISGLACGKPIRGHVAFLGGPLHFMSELRKRFIETLNLTDETAIVPEDSHIFAAFGAAISIEGITREMDFAEFADRVDKVKSFEMEVNRLEPLFKDEEEYRNFKERHNREKVRRVDLKTYSGNAFLGIDAGSTTTKVALVSDKGELLYSFYKSNEGRPLKVVIRAIEALYDEMPDMVKIKNSCITGYGEGLIKEALMVDLGYIETVAHYKAAAFFKPDVDFILDIGGQDMKCIKIKDGVIDNVLLNEACSSGCGSFIETFAKGLNYKVEDFAKVALFSKNPIDLGSRCTVFMNSRVKQAQKEGAQVNDISAGLAYSIIKNALLKVIKISDPKALGKSIVVQGGTFYNDAVLKSFEFISEREAVRPDISGIMGAFGAALIACEKYKEGYESTLLSREEMNNLAIKATHARCGKCTNNCLLTINTFDKGRRFITGNRCEIGEGIVKTGKEIPNLYEYKKQRLFNYKSLPKEKAKRGKIGIPRVLNMYENYPFWHTFLTHLGFSIELSPFSNKDVYEEGMESIPSESVCYPAKLVHGHVMHLIQDGIKTIFYPGVVYERPDIKDADEVYNCPIVASYSENIKNNMEDLVDKNIKFLNPFISFKNKKALKSRLYEEFASYGVIRDEINKAVDYGFNEWDNFRNDMHQKGEEALKYIREHNLKGIVLGGRPYHVDPEINHGIPELIAGFNIAIFTEDSIAHLGQVERPLMVRDQWMYHSRLYEAAAFVKKQDDLEYVQLNSFGCGLDAVTIDEVKDILSAAGKIYTSLKIDEVNNLGAARIRIRSLIAAMEDRQEMNIHAKESRTSFKRTEFTKNMKDEYTLICPQMAPMHFDLLETALNSCGYKVAMMPSLDKNCVDTGLKYVNNDACYPALISIGQIMNALMNGEYDINKVAVLMTQTGGGCRATNYIGFIRKAFKNAGLEHVPVISVSAQGIEKNSGWTYNYNMLKKIGQALVYGDLFMRVVYATRPYEEEKGSVNALYEQMNALVKNDLEKGKNFNRNIDMIVNAFDEMPLLNISKPKVGVVGEILVKFHPTANNDIVGLLEKEGAEAVVPDLLGFAMYSGYNSVVKHRYLGTSFKSKLIGHGVIEILEMCRGHMKKALNKSKRFTSPDRIEDLARYAEPFVSLCNQTGEGWFLTGEMMELIHTGVNNIICTQPFACLPNHIVGKGVIKELKRVYPLSNIVAIDYDPGASEVNQLNRIRLMLATANKNLQAEIIEKDIITNKSLLNKGAIHANF